MFADSAAIAVLSLVVGVPVLAFLFWAVRNGQFEKLDQSALVIFEDDELRYERPWESDEHARERVARYGEAMPARRQGWRKWL